MENSSNKNSSKDAQCSSLSPSNPHPNRNIETIISMKTLTLEEDTPVEMESSSNSKNNSNNNSKGAKPFSVSSSSNSNPNRNPNVSTATKAMETLTLEEETSGQNLKNIEKLAPDLIEEILSRLPFDSLFLCKQVCPSWRSLFQHSDHRLPKLHYTRSIQNPNDPTSLIIFNDPTSLIIFNDPTSLIIFNDPRSRIATATFPSLHYVHNIDTCEEAIEVQTPFRSFFGGLGIVGSCNGLLCLTDVVDMNQSDSTVILSNPVIGDWIKLPDFPGKSSVIHFGFGYVPRTNEYKVLQMHRSAGCPLKVSILTLGSNAWRNIGTTTCGIIWDHVFGVHLNGVLHWLIFDSNTYAEGIKTFNLDDETFGVVSLPDSIKGKRFSFRNGFCLGVLGGCLMMVDHTQELLQQVWLMKDFENKSWILEYIIPKPRYSAGRPEIRPLKMLKNGNILLECAERLYCYDPITRTHELLKVPGLPYYFTASYPHLGTFVTVQDVIAMKVPSSMTEEQPDMSTAGGYDDDNNGEDDGEDPEEQRVCGRCIWI